MSAYTKNFDGWHPIKKDTENRARRWEFNEREIWWCRIGVNVGNEMDGKNAFFERPVLIVRKFSKELFWGVAMSKQIKESEYYFPLEFQGERCSVLLSHLRLYDAKRLYRLKGTLPHHKFNEIREALGKILENKE